MKDLWLGEPSRYGDLSTGWTTDHSCFDSRQGLQIFILSSTSRLALHVTQTSIQEVPADSFPEVTWLGVNLTVICNWCRVSSISEVYLGIILWRRTWFLVCGLIFVGLAMTEAVSIACLSQRRSAFDDGPYHVRFVVDKMVLEDWALLRVLGPFAVNVIPPILHTYCHL